MPLTLTIFRQENEYDGMCEKKLTIAIAPGTGSAACAWLEVAGILREAGHDIYVLTLSNLEERGLCGRADADLVEQIKASIGVEGWGDLAMSDIVIVGQSQDGALLMQGKKAAPIHSPASEATARSETRCESRYRWRQNGAASVERVVEELDVEVAAADRLSAAVSPAKTSNEDHERRAGSRPHDRPVWRKLPATHNFHMFPKETAALIVAAANG